MHWKRPALAVGIAVIAVACTTTGTPSGDDIVKSVPSSTTTVAETSKAQITQSAEIPPEPSIDTTTTAPESMTTTTTTARAADTPAASTTTTAAPDQVSTITTAPSNADIEALLDTLDDLLGDIDDQLDDVDSAVDQAGDSLNQNEGDIGQ